MPVAPQEMMRFQSYILHHTSMKVKLASYGTYSTETILSPRIRNCVHGFVITNLILVLVLSLFVCMYVFDSMFAHAYFIISLCAVV
jgi:hypothetical protein